MRMLFVLIGACIALSVRADPVTLSCTIDAQNRPESLRTTFQLVFDEAAQTATVGNNSPTHASISAGVISYSTPLAGYGNAVTTIDRTSGDISITAADGALLFAGHCVKVDPARRAF